MNSKNRLIALIVGILLMAFVCYSLAFSKTMALRKEYKLLESEASLFQDNPKQLALLSLKQKQYDSILNTLNLGKTSIENNLLRIINIQADKNNIKVIDFNESHIFEDKTKTFDTFDFTLQGDFNNLLKTVYALEAKNSFGEVIHLDFQKQKDYRTNRKVLSSRIFLQHIK